MKKHILTILTFGLIFGAMFASVQTAYADDTTASEPEGCIAFTSSEQFTVSLGTSQLGNTWDGTVQYSTDGDNWTDYAAGTVVDAESISGKYSVFFRGENNKYINKDTSTKVCSSFQLSDSGPISCSGNIETLLDYWTVQNGKHPEMGNYAFTFLFKDCVNLTETPKLSATALSPYCYSAMFYGCTGLNKAPELPATTLADYCYADMFFNCRGLTKAPELPATTLSPYCYYEMFILCDSLANAPELPATMLVPYCYTRMFYNCMSLTKAPELPATTLADHCYESMFYYCSKLTVPSILPATILTDYCYHNMFYGSGVGISEEQGYIIDVYFGLPYRIPKEGDGSAATESLKEMFSKLYTYGAEPVDMNKTYYLVTPGWTGRGTETDPFVISDATGWHTLITYVNAGYSMEGLCFQLGANIEVTDMVGTYEKPFSGSFDGAGHTLTFNADDAPELCAPFVYVKNASFKNLHIAGTIKTNQKFAAGLIGHFDGTVKVTNCKCGITIDSAVKKDGTHGGFIAAGEKDGAALFEGCIFDGMMLGSETTNCGGFLGWANPTDKTYTVKNCLFAPQELTLRSDLVNFIRNAPETTAIQNSYYIKHINDNSQGKSVRSVTADEGITVGAKAISYNVSGITAYETGMIYGDKFYAGVNDAVAVTIPSASYLVTASAGTLTGAGTSFMLTMPDEDVHLTLSKAADTPADPDIPVVNTAKISTECNLTKKQMTIAFPADASVDNYLIQYRLAGKTSWSSGWSEGRDSYTVKGLKRYSLCEFRITGFTKQTDGSWNRGNWSKVSYRYINIVPLKTIKAGKKRITITWKKDKKASGYQINYSLKKDMTGAKTITIKSKNTTKYTIKKLKSGKKYYIKVRPFKTKSGKKYLGILDKAKATKAK